MCQAPSWAARARVAIPECGAAVRPGAVYKPQVVWPYSAGSWSGMCLLYAVCRWAVFGEHERLHYF